jgi:hypothetical protein
VSVMVMWEGRVPEAQWPALRQVYTKMSGEEPDGITATWILQDSEDPELWRLVSLWRDRETLESYRARAAGKPGGLVMFETVGVTPTRHFFDVAVERS